MPSADDPRQLSARERRALRALRSHGSRAVDLGTLATDLALESENAAFGLVSWLREKGLVEIEERRQRAYRVGADGARFARERLPEHQVHRHVARLGRPCSLTELKQQFSDATLNIALAWWKRKSLGTIEKGGTDTVLRAHPQPPTLGDEELLRDLVRRVGEAGPVPEGAAREPNPKAFDALRTRPGVLEPMEVVQRFARLSSRGQELPPEAFEAVEVEGEITPELIQSGAWRGKELQAYDLRTAAPRTFGAKPHPLVQIIKEVKEIFVELGFEEIEEEYVQSAFWNLDALFIPQDHPAREMQDTFYLEHPKTMPFPEDTFETISKVHKSGGATRSRGWGQTLDRKESARALLRTHTTVGTIRHLAAHPEPPVRVFSVGRVFRHETMDATHLPEFHQVEGIATEEGADFPMLLGILQEFYRRLGFPTLRWRPAYFPYTEPSMEVEVWTGEKWMELGGCGVFRPEVTQPFGVKTPVLAWGLGLERLAMRRLGLRDIRDLYVSDLEWLRGQPLL